MLQHIDTSVNTQHPCTHAHYSAGRSRTPASARLGNGNIGPHRDLLETNTRVICNWPAMRLTKTVWLDVDRSQFSRCEAGQQVFSAESQYNARVWGLMPPAVIAELESLEPADETQFDPDGDGVECDPDDLEKQRERVREIARQYEAEPTDANARQYQLATNQLHKMHRRAEGDWRRRVGKQAKN